LPLPGVAGRHISNSDPVTGQAGWYDLRVRISPAAPDEAAETFPQVEPTPTPPGVSRTVTRVMQFFAGRQQ
jgi:hypothetical protein